MSKLTPTFGWIMLGVVSITLGVGYELLPNLFASVDVTPQQIRIEDECPDFAPVEFTITTSNNYKQDVSISQFTVSCKCVKALLGSTRLPIVIPAGGSVETRFEVDPESYAGPTHHSVLPIVHLGNRKLDVNPVLVEFNTLVSTSMVPPRVVFQNAQPGETFERQVLIADGLPVGSNKIVNVEASAPDRLVADITSQSSEDSVKVKQQLVTARHRAKISYQVPEIDSLARTTLNDYVEFTSTFRGKEYKKRLPVICHVDPLISVIPETAVLSLASVGREASCELSCSCREEEPGLLTVVNAPDGLNVSVSEEADEAMWKIKVAGDSTLSAASTPLKIELRFGSGKVFSIPVVIIPTTN